MKEVSVIGSDRKAYVAVEHKETATALIFYPATDNSIAMIEICDGLKDGRYLPSHEPRMDIDLRNFQDLYSFFGLVDYVE